MQHTLEVFCNGQSVFTSESAWLHPLFELEHAIASVPLDPATLSVHDKIVGAASAFLLAHLGIRTLHAKILSRYGESVLKRFGISYTFDTLIDRVGCKTESLLDPNMDADRAITILRARAARQE